HGRTEEPGTFRGSPRTLPRSANARCRTDRPFLQRHFPAGAHALSGGLRPLRENSVCGEPCEPDSRRQVPEAVGEGRFVEGAELHKFVAFAVWRRIQEPVSQTGVFIVTG